MLSVSGGCPLTIIVSRAVLASKGLSWPLAAGGHRANRTVVSVNSLENNPRFAVAAPKVVAIIPSLTHCGPLYRARDVDAAGTGSGHREPHYGPHTGQLIREAIMPEADRNSTRLNSSHL